MKKSIRYSSLFLGLAMVAQLQGCYGNFALTRKLYTWNGTLGDKWINSVVMFAMMVIPVYGVAGFVDYVVLNTVQFWTGKNPVAMKEGEKEIQMVHWKGKDYRLTATSNRLDVEPMVDGKAGAAASLVFDIRTQSWSASAPGTQSRIIEMVGEEGNIADLVYPDGRKQRVELVQN